MTQFSQIADLDRYYRDPRGVVVHVIGYDRVNQRVIYRRSGYEHDCARSLDAFKALFTRIEK